MAGNKPTVTAWRSATPTTNTPLVADNDADLFAVLRRLAAKYTAKAEYLGRLALVTDKPAEVARTAVRYAEAAQRTEALIG